ncbi:MAG: DUF975 family protein [Peptostreptococcaceae bacterium]
MNRAELKSLSKNQLKGHWKVPVLLTLIYVGLVFILSLTQSFSTSEIASLLFLILTLVIEIWAVVGFPNFYLKFIKNNDDITLRDFFVSNNLLVKSLGFVLLMSLIGGIVGLVIGITIASSMFYTILLGSSFSASVVGLIIVILVIGIVLTIFSLSIAITPFLLVDKEGIKLFEAMGLSVKMMKGYKWKFFVLYLSFIGWALLCVLTLGIGYLWLSPYISLTYANFYIAIDKNYQ